ncbi:MAG: methyltransferase domain-containing protein [Bacteroidota bacterium]
MKKTYAQYGCGLSAPAEWLNYDVSPTLRMQKIPVLGGIFRSTVKTVFPRNVLYGDIIKGLPLPNNSVDGLYCSHTLEHLSLADFRKALQHSYEVLKPGGVFRCVLPDLEYSARVYLEKLEQGEADASIWFMNDTLLGIKARARGLNGLLRGFFGNSHHLWMWDHKSLASELEKAGFKNVRKCLAGDSGDEMFALVVDPGRFVNALALECSK